MSDFFQRVKAFNQMYGIPTPGAPFTSRSEVRHRLVEEFLPMLRQEVAEGDEVVDQLGELPMIDVLTALADWYGDLIVYCASEMSRHGIPAEAVLSIIMDSNASKLQADGTALLINGKLQKGPNYWKPEPKIKALLDSLVYANNWSNTDGTD